MAQRVRIAMPGQERNCWTTGLVLSKRPLNSFLLAKTMEKKEPPANPYAMYYDFAVTPPAVAVSNASFADRRDPIAEPNKPVALAPIELVDPVVIVEQTSTEPCWYQRALRYVVYNALNVALSFAGFAIVLLGFGLGVGLIPLFCLGLLVLELLILAIRTLGRLDVQLANTLPCSQRAVTLHPDLQNGLSLTDPRSWPRLFLLSLGYFVIVKFITGFLSLTALAWVFVLPVQAIGGYPVTVASGSLTFDSNAGLFVLATSGCWLMGILLLPLIARLSWSLTKFVCAANDQKDEQSADGGKEGRI